MFRLIVRRLISGLVLLLAVTFLAYVLLFLSSSDIARNILGPTATAAQVARKSVELGLNQPLITRYISWLGDAVTGNLGTSWLTAQPVSDAIATRLPVTLSLIIGVTIVSALVGVIVGMATAIYRGWFDKVIQVLTVFGFALPGFLVALGLIFILALGLRWFPATGYTPLTQSPAGWISTITLPIAALSIAAIAAIAQQVRSAALAILNQDFVRTLRSRGLSERRIVFLHVLRNAATPALTVLALQFVGLLSGAVIVEQLFSLPGVGAIGVTATSGGDIPTVMGVVVVTVIIVITINLLVDIAVGWLNPKARRA
jgi:peptide/nickel transport system permease protein